MTDSPTELIYFILRQAVPDVFIESEDYIQPRALSQDRYVFVQELSTQAGPWVDQIDTPRIEIICYAQGGRLAAIEFGKECRRALYAAWSEQQVTPFGHLAGFTTNIRPTVQAITGLKTATRVYAQYSVITCPPKS